MVEQKYQGGQAIVDILTKYGFEFVENDNPGDANFTFFGRHDKIHPKKDPNPKDPKKNTYVYRPLVIMDIGGKYARAEGDKIVEDVRKYASWKDRYVEYQRATAPLDEYDGCPSRGYVTDLHNYLVGLKLLKRPQLDINRLEGRNAMEVFVVETLDLIQNPRSNAFKTFDPEDVIGHMFLADMDPNKAAYHFVEFIERHILVIKKQKPINSKELIADWKSLMKCISGWTKERSDALPF